MQAWCKFEQTISMATLQFKKLKEFTSPTKVKHKRTNRIMHFVWQKTVTFFYLFPLKDYSKQKMKSNEESYIPITHILHMLILNYITFWAIFIWSYNHLVKQSTKYWMHLFNLTILSRFQQKVFSIISLSFWTITLRYLNWPFLGITWSTLLHLLNFSLDTFNFQFTQLETF